MTCKTNGLIVTRVQYESWFTINEMLILKVEGQVNHMNDVLYNKRWPETWVPVFQVTSETHVYLQECINASMMTADD